MNSDSEQTSLTAEPQNHSESFKLKLGFTERNLQRIKEENIRINQKVVRLEEENARLNSQNNKLLEQIQALSTAVSRQKAEKENLIRKLEMRTQRHQEQQTKNISFGEKEVIEKRIRKAETDLLAMKDQKDIFAQKCYRLTTQLQQEKRENSLQKQQIIALQQQSLQDIEKVNEVEGLYKEKIRILQYENSELKKQTDSLVLEVKLFERKKQIQNLLDYQNRIGNESPQNSMRRPSGEFRRQNTGSQCCCTQLEDELWERQELIELLKQKNMRLSQQVESVKRRCVTLQSIICKNGPIK